MNFAEESEEGDNVEEANVQLLISFVILFDLLMSSVHVIILSGYLDSCISGYLDTLDSLPYLYYHSSKIYRKIFYTFV